MISKAAAESKLESEAERCQPVAIPDVPGLTSLVTITVEKYLAAVGEAYNGAN